jgi:hypothetical protein
MDNGHPVTRAELREELVGMMAAMRQIETNMLTAFHGYARGVSAHLHDLDTGHDIKIRLSALEDRILNLETRRPI